MKLSGDIERIIEGKASWEPLGFRVIDYEGIRKQVPRQLLELARQHKDRSSSRATESMGGVREGEEIGIECAKVLRALCASLLILPAVAPEGSPVWNIEEIAIADAVTYFRKGLADRLAGPILHAPTYPNWEVAVGCYALALEGEYRGPIYLGTTRAPNAEDEALGVWNFSIDTTRLIQKWDAYVAFCEQNDWYRDRILGLTPPGLLR